MWIIFSLLCMVALTASEIIGKKAVVLDELAPIKLRIMVMLVAILFSIIMYAFNLGESGLAPWKLMIDNPLILALVCCSTISEFLYMFCLKYIGMTIMEVISSFEGIFIFAGLIIISVITGGFSTLNDMTSPLRFIFIFLILICTILLPQIDFLTNKNRKINNEQKSKKKKIVIGILIALLAAIFSCGDSLITDTLLDSETIGTVDITMTAYFSQIVLLPIFLLILAFKSKLKKDSFKIVNKYSLLYSIFFVVNVFIGFIAISIDAVRSEIMFLTYPVISIVGARIILKEKYSWRQNICIWVITLSSIAFCVIDYLG